MVTQVASDFLPSGGSGFLGVPYPKISKEYDDMGNVSFHSSHAAYTVRGRRAPTKSDPYTHFSIGVLPAFTDVALVRGENASFSTAIWSKTATQLGVPRIYAYWHDAATDDIYVAGPNAANFIVIVKVAFSNGAATIVGTGNLFAPLSQVTTATWHVAPRDTSNPTTTVWDMVANTSNTSFLLKHYSIDLDAGTDSVNDIRVDTGDTNQAVASPVQYITIDKKIILGEWRSGFDIAGRRMVFFTLAKGSVRTFVSIPYDGNIPFVEQTIPDLHNFRPSDDGQDSNNREAVAIDVWNNSIIFTAFDHGGTDVMPWVIGKRLFDRVDFDRWLNDISKELGMPTGEEFF